MQWTDAGNFFNLFIRNNSVLTGQQHKAKTHILVSSIWRICTVFEVNNKHACAVNTLNDQN